MPRGDRSGPAGLGPKTGRGTGFCTGNNQPGFASNFGGGGLRRGRRNRNFAAGNPRRATQMPYDSPNVPVEPLQQISTEQEIEMLKTESKNLQSSLKNIKKRLTELSAKKEEI